MEQEGARKSSSKQETDGVDYFARERFIIEASIVIRIQLDGAAIVIGSRINYVRPLDRCVCKTVVFCKPRKKNPRPPHIVRVPS